MEFRAGGSRRTQRIDEQIVLCFIHVEEIDRLSNDADIRLKTGENSVRAARSQRLP